MLTTIWSGLDMYTVWGVIWLIIAFIFFAAGVIVGLVGDKFLTPFGLGFAEVCLSGLFREVTIRFRLKEVEFE